MQVHPLEARGMNHPRGGGFLLVFWLARLRLAEGCLSEFSIAMQFVRRGWL